MITYDGIIVNIKSIISEKGVKQCSVAKRAGIEEKTFSNMLNHRKKIPADAIPRIAKALNVSIGTLFKDTAPTPPEKRA